MKTTPIDKAFRKVFRRLVTRDRTLATYQGKHWAWPGLDPGKWAPRSLLIIYHESGLPERALHPHMGPYWDNLVKELEDVFGFPVYLENINQAVTAVYKG